MRRSWAALAVLASASAGAMPAGGLEPEPGVFASEHAPDPATLALRDALLGGYAYRQCQFLVEPSLRTPYAVFLVRQAGGVIVVSRTLDEQRWSRLEIERIRALKPDVFPLDAATERALLKRFPVVAQTRQAPLDAESTAVLTDLCRDVLLQVRYPKKFEEGLDGVTYHAGHWTQERFLSGTAWSPDADSLTGDYVAMGQALKAFADAPEAQREARKGELLERARRVADRLRDSRPAELDRPSPLQSRHD
ncbi:hypothetical protein ACG04R_21740 [Roseateles sp. BYS78W]|uniref:Uncharacterized protein n=1 Tax=Pelomonas candidula TaxID=3299025 RepID=A0ABW7HHF2_9BURK